MSAGLFFFFVVFLAAHVAAVMGVVRTQHRRDISR